jgi:hypothetical protein
MQVITAKLAADLRDPRRADAGGLRHGLHLLAEGELFEDLQFLRG